MEHIPCNRTAAVDVMTSLSDSCFPRKDCSQKHPIRIGIDFGNTIGEINESPAPHAFEIIKHLVHKFGAENVFIVSKAGPVMVERIILWLRMHEFHERTGFFQISNHLCPYLCRKERHS